MKIKRDGSINHNKKLFRLSPTTWHPRWAVSGALFYAKVWNECLMVVAFIASCTPMNLEMNCRKGSFSIIHKLPSSFQWTIAIECAFHIHQVTRSIEWQSFWFNWHQTFENIGFRSDIELIWLPGDEQETNHYELCRRKLNRKR